MMMNLNGFRRLAPLLAVTAAGLLFALPANAAIKAKIVAGTVTITGDGADDRVSLALDGASPRNLLVDVGDDGSTDFTFAGGTFTGVDVATGGGNDDVTIGNIFASAGVPVTINGGGGNDTITDGDGSDTLIGGTGADTITGGRGNDTALLGSGADTFVWNPGDGSDTVEGQDGRDTLAFNGSNIGEQIDLAANGPRLRFTRDVAGIVMDVDGVEVVNFTAIGGAHPLTRHDPIRTAC